MDEKLAGRIRASFGGTDGSAGSSLDTLCRQLNDEQQGSWPEFKSACISLSGTRERDIECSGFSVKVIYNPGRSVNTLAAVTPEDIRRRPCFLCAGNLPAEQKAVMYRNDFLILVNPRPILPLHLTIAHREHQPQSLYQSVEDFLRITEDIGPGFTTLYNGPQCGASAPDHLHFQAVPSGMMPVETDLYARKRFFVLKKTGRVTLSSARGLGREMVLIEGGDSGNISSAFREFAAALPTGPGDDEPMINAIGHFNGAFHLAVFPRRSHRPAAFFRDDDLRIMVSPAVIEMGGIIVTPSEADFERLDAPVIESIYQEVSLIEYSRL